MLPSPNIMEKIDQSGYLSQTSIELSKFDVQYKPQLAINKQALAKYMAKWIEDESIIDPKNTNKEVALVKVPIPNPWMVYLDGACNFKGFGMGIAIFIPQED